MNASGKGRRILQLGPLPPPVGGMATVVENLVAELGRDHELRVLNNVKTTAADRSLWQGIAAQLRLLWQLARLCLGWRPQVVHIHTCSWFTFWRNSVDVLLARLLGRPVVLHIHGAQFHKFLASLSPPAAFMARRVFGLASRVVVLGEQWKALLDQWAAPAKVRVVPNGVPVAEPLAADPGGDFGIVCLANYELRKGQADLLRALAGLQGGRGVRLQLLGFESEPGQRQALLDLAAELGIAERVDIPGPVTGDDKERRFRSARCFCLPSYDEGLPMAMLEAMAMGMPVVVTAVGAIPEALVDGAEGLIYPAGEVAALAAHLQALLDDPERCRVLGEAGRKRLICDFSLERSADLLRAVYAELA